MPVSGGALCSDGDEVACRQPFACESGERNASHGIACRPLLFIRTAFLFRPNVVVTAVPYLVGRAVRLRDAVMYEQTLDR